MWWWIVWRKISHLAAQGVDNFRQLSDDWNAAIKIVFTSKWTKYFHCFMFSLQNIFLKHGQNSALSHFYQLILIHLHWDLPRVMIILVDAVQNFSSNHITNCETELTGWRVLPGRGVWLNCTKLTNKISLTTQFVTITWAGVETHQCGAIKKYINFKK